MRPLISICMPNHNYENYINEAIESVLSQTYTNFELIIVDDMSTDRSVEIIESYSDPRIKLHKNSTNLYTFRTNNKALSLAQGDLLAVLHSDDKYEPTFLEEIVDAYNDYPSHKVFITGIYFYHSNNNRLIPWHPYKSGGNKSQKEVMTRLLHQNNIGNGANVVFHKNCLKKTGMFSVEYKYIADYDFLLRLGNDYEFVYIPRMLAYYRVHESNATSSNIKQPDRDKEALKIVIKNLAQSKIIPKKQYKKLFYLAKCNGLHKAFYMGFRYNSGSLIRLRLNSQKELDPGLTYDPYWYLLYWYSYFVNENLPKYLLSLIYFAGKLLLYPNKLYVNRLVDKLAKEK